MPPAYGKLKMFISHNLIIPRIIDFDIKKERKGNEYGNSNKLLYKK